MRDRQTGKDTRQVRRGLITRPGLGAESIRRVHSLLHVALEKAVSDGYLKSSPADGAAKEVGDGEAEPGEPPAWSKEELLGFLTSQRDTEFGPLWRVLAYTRRLPQGRVGGRSRFTACGTHTRPSCDRPACPFTSSPRGSVMPRRSLR